MLITKSLVVSCVLLKSLFILEISFSTLISPVPTVDLLIWFFTNPSLVPTFTFTVDIPFLPTPKPPPVYPPAFTWLSSKSVATSFLAFILVLLSFNEPNNAPFNSIVSFTFKSKFSFATIPDCSWVQDLFSFPIPVVIPILAVGVIPLVDKTAPALALAFILVELSVLVSCKETISNLLPISPLKSLATIFPFIFASLEVFKLNLSSTFILDIKLSFCFEFIITVEESILICAPTFPPSISTPIFPSKSTLFEYPFSVLSNVFSPEFNMKFSPSTFKFLVFMSVLVIETLFLAI